MFDEAKALAVTMKMRKLTQTEMAKSLGVSPSYISNKLRLLSLSEEIQKEIILSGLSERHARALLHLKSESDRQKVLKEAIEKSLTVAEIESLIDHYYLSSQTGYLKETEIFLEGLDKLVTPLIQSGIKVEKQVLYEENKALITICITE